MAAAGYPLSLHVLCGSCQTVVGAPLGHPVVRCGNCSSLLRIGGAVRFGSHQQSLSPAIQEYLAQRRAAATRTQQSQPASKAASQSAIDALKRFSATEAWLRDEGNPECVITAEEFKKGDEVLQMPCGHYFKPDGLLQWLSQNHTCPVCRHEVEPAQPAPGSDWAAGGARSAAAAPSAAAPSEGTASTAAQPQFLQGSDGRIVLSGRAMTGAGRSTRPSGGGGCTVQ